MWKRNHKDYLQYITIVYVWLYQFFICNSTIAIAGWTLIPIYLLPVIPPLHSEKGWDRVGIGLTGATKFTDREQHAHCHIEVSFRFSKLELSKRWMYVMVSNLLPGNDSPGDMSYFTVGSQRTQTRVLRTPSGSHFPPISYQCLSCHVRPWCKSSLPRWYGWN